MNLNSEYICFVNLNKIDITNFFCYFLSFYSLNHIINKVRKPV